MQETSEVYNPEIGENLCDSFLILGMHFLKTDTLLLHFGG